MIHEDKTGEYTFTGFEIAQTVAPEISNVVTAACMRNAATKFGHLFFGSHLMEAEEAEFAAEAADASQGERWPGIQQALRAPVKRLALLNPFAAADVQARARAAQGLRAHEEIPDVHDCPDDPPPDPEAAALRAASVVGDEGEGPPPRAPEARRPEPGAPPALLPCCFLSGAAVLAAQALGAAPGERVLDLCAGPGAKALVLASALFGGAPEGAAALELAGAESGLLAAEAAAAAPRARGGLLVCNEPHRGRGQLLEAVLASFVPGELLRGGGAGGGRVLVTRAEASSRVPPALKRLAPFDRVLVDPPCTAARAAARRRGPARGAAKTEHAELMEELLRCAGALLRPGGLLVYATSSLDGEENDGAVRRFLRREGGGFAVEPGEDDSPILGAERTELGTLVLPDQGTEHGPLYFSRLRRS